MHKSIYLKATIALLFYSIISKAIFATSVVKGSFANSLIFPMLFGMAASCFFLYLFSHDDFLKFVKAIEIKEQRREKVWLYRVRHFSKILSTLAIGIIAGPILSALTTRILLRNYKFKYLLVIFISIPSTILSVGIAKGVISIF